MLFRSYCMNKCLQPAVAAAYKPEQKQSHLCKMGWFNWGFHWDTYSFDYFKTNFKSIHSYYSSVSWLGTEAVQLVSTNYHTEAWPKWPPLCWHFKMKTLYWLDSRKRLRLGRVMGFSLLSLNPWRMDYLWLLYSSEPMKNGLSLTLSSEPMKNGLSLTLI